jgi:hypothetical protein
MQVALTQRLKEIEKLTPEEQQAVVTAPGFREEARRMGVARMLAAPIPRTLAGLLGRLSPAQWAVLREGRPLVFSTDRQPSELPLPEEIHRVLRASQPTMYPPGARPVFRDSNEEERARQREKEMQEGWAAATGYRVSIRLDGARLQTSGMMSLNAYARPFRTGATGARPTPFFGGPGSSLSIYATTRDPDATMSEDTPERRAALEKDPVLGVKRDFKPEAKPNVETFGPASRATWRFGDLLPDLARTYQVHFLSDAYTTGFFSSGPPTSEPVALFTLLDRQRFSHRWERRGNLIRMRSRTWFVDRPREIPLRLTRGWQRLLEERGSLPLETFIEMATALTDAQLENLYNVLRSPGRPGPPDLFQVTSARHVLRLYAALSPAQRQALLQGAALPVAQMTPAQRGLFLAGLQERARYRNPPPAMQHLAAGSFQVTVRQVVRVTEQRDGTTFVRFETVSSPAGTPGAAAAAPRATSTGPPAATAPPAPPGRGPAPGSPDGPNRPAPGPAAGAVVGPPAAGRQPMTQVSFVIHYGPELRESYTLTAAPRE